MSIAIFLVLLLPQEKPAPEEKKADGFNVKMPLVESVTIGGQVRLRGEFKDVASYASATLDPKPSSDTIAERVRLHLDTTVVKDLRAFVQIQDSRTWGDESSVGSLNVDSAELMLKQGFLEVKNIGGVPFSVKAGRMEVPNLGDQRLISSLEWDNVGRSWDGVHLTYAPEGWSLLGITTITRDGNVLGSSSGDDYLVTGLYASCKKLKDHEFDLYFFHRNLSNDDFTSESSVKGDRKDFTLGGRAKGKTGSFDYTGEIVYQFGDQAGDDIGAWALALTAGFTFDHDWKPRIGLEYAFASGDKDPTDGKVGTFQALYPFGHYYHGHIDFVGWRNIHDFLVAARVQPAKSWTIHLDTHFFWLAQERDFWYGASGSGIRRDTTGAASRTLGWEIDLYSKWKLVEDRLDFWAGYSRFFAGKFVDDTGDDPDANWLFLQVVLNI